MTTQPRLLGRPSTTHHGTDVEARKVRGWMKQHGLLTYTLMAYGISWSLLLGGFLGSQAGILDPDGGPVGLMIQFAAAGPLIAAVVVLALTSGRTGLAGLGRSLIRWRVNPLWYAFIFLGVPLLMVVVITAFYAPDMVPALAQNWSLLYTQLPLSVLTIAIFTGLAEEPGWRGYAQPTTNQRHRPLVAALVVSVIWAAWHLPNALFGQTATETVTHLLATMVNGLVLAWAYNSTGGSVLIVMLLHGAQNATAGLMANLLEGSQSGPTASVYYLISAMTFGVLIMVVAVLTRGRLGTKPLPTGSGNHPDNDPRQRGTVSR